MRQLLVPSKLAVVRVLGDKVPWKCMREGLKHSSNSSLRPESEDIQCCDNPATVVRKVEPYPYEPLPRVILLGASQSRCENCRFHAWLVPRQQDLDRALVSLVLLKPASLAGSELRFLRKVSGLSLEALSRHLNISMATLIAWEARTALRYRNDLATRLVLASIIDPDAGYPLIPRILDSIRIGKKELDPVYARWSEAESKWTIEPVDPAKCLRG